MSKATQQNGPGDSSDLQSQLEEILTSVWAAEANWRFDDRLDLSIAADAIKNSVRGWLRRAGLLGKANLVVRH